MRFGGHETFHIRDNWLYKGLNLLMHDPEGFVGPEAADKLGVGGNMAKSIRHWIQATGIAEKMTLDANQVRFKPSKLGTVISEYDPYFTNPATWWALHVNLVNSPTLAASWDWLFNHFGQHRFEKGVAVENLKRFLTYHTNHRPPAQRTMERDVGVLLNSYSKSIPGEDLDPEDSKDCPLQALGLMSYFRDSGFYRLSFAEKRISPELLGYAMSRALPDEVQVEKNFSVTITEATNSPCNPGKVFCLRAESIFDLALHAEKELERGWLTVSGLAGSRNITFRPWPAEQWLETLYQREAEQFEACQNNQKNNLLAPY